MHMGESGSAPCDACDGHGFWVEGAKPGRVKACDVCDGSGVLPDDEESS